MILYVWKESLSDERKEERKKDELNYKGMSDKYFYMEIYLIKAI